MGIPSYYKRLIDTVPGLVSKGHPTGIQWLFMDFNCLIYHCLHRDDTPIYPGDADKDAWETLFLDCIVTYCLKVIKEVQPTKGVFIAIDGVVPMAKMRQQRLRRFKSAWMTKNGVGEVKKDIDGNPIPVWDRNAITPGTMFMKKLREKLEKMISKHGKKTWKLSSSDEPGEGEHKIIQEWRTGHYSGDFAVYGLDADLIVLSILGREQLQLSNRIFLFREEVQAGKMVYNDIGEEEFEWFSIDTLRNWLATGWDDAETQSTFILQYCFAMSVLGNDFLPTSLGLKIRDDGHTELLELLRSLVSKRQFIIQSNLEISFDGVLALFDALSAEEATRIAKYVSKKCNMAQRMMEQNTTENNIQEGDNDWPLYHIEEDRLIEHRKLVPEWQSVYLSFFHGSIGQSSISQICQDYIYGIQWIWAYYTGQWDQVCFNWYYPHSLPPLWEWIREELIRTQALQTFPTLIRIRATDIQPVEQLCLVLPLESWSLLPSSPLRKLPVLAPHLFPQSFSFDTLGKRFFWECESMIPLPSICTVKEIIASS